MVSYFIEERGTGWRSRPVEFETDDDALAGIAELGWTDLDLDHTYRPVDTGWGTVAAKRVLATEKKG